MLLHCIQFNAKCIRSLRPYHVDDVFVYDGYYEGIFFRNISKCRLRNTSIKFQVKFHPHTIFEDNSSNFFYETLYSNGMNVAKAVLLVNFSAASPIRWDMLCEFCSMRWGQHVTKIIFQCHNHHTMHSLAKFSSYQQKKFIWTEKIPCVYSVKKQNK